MASNESSDSVPEWVRVERGRRADLKRRYASLFDELSAVLFEADPAGINFGHNTDEYDAEAGTILPRLDRCTGIDDVQAVVFEEFVRWFGRDHAGEDSDYRDVAERIWRLWTSNAKNSR